MAFVFALGVVSGIAAALLRRYRRASSMALAGGAGVSLGRRKKLFWLGWGIHAAFTSYVVAVVIWLEFFWHW